MTGIWPSIIAAQPFFRTGEQPCPYLPGRAERKIITDLSGPHALALYDQLSRVGFRRSHRLGYRPACAGCSACLPVRVVAGKAGETRSLKRVAKRNFDLVQGMEAPVATLEHYRLFRRYEMARHAESDMAGMCFADYRAMIEDSPIDTHLLTLRDGDGALMGVCLFDRLDDGDSAVYSFFEPDTPDRSLGTQLVLALIGEVRRRNAAYVYLGYWVPGSRKMDYKRRFQPLEALGPEGWRPIDPD